MFRNYWRKTATIVGLSVMMAAASGCLVASNSSTTVTGTKVAPTTFDQIKPGSTTIDWVRATLDEANSKTREGKGEIWKYTCTEHTNASSAVFLVFAGSNSNETIDTVFIEFKDGIVTNKWRG